MSLLPSGAHACDKQSYSVQVITTKSSLNMVIANEIFTFPLLFLMSFSSGGKDLFAVEK